MKLLVEHIEHVMILAEESVLLTVWHMTNGVIFTNQLLHLLLQSFYFSLCELLELSHDTALLLQVIILFMTLTCSCCIACLEELIACTEEIIPKLVTELAWHHTYLLPVLLQLDKFVACSLPICRVSERLCFSYECLLLLDIFVITILYFLEECFLCIEEYIA